MRAPVYNIEVKGKQETLDLEVIKQVVGRLHSLVSVSVQFMPVEQACEVLQAVRNHGKVETVTIAVQKIDEKII